MNRIFNQVSEKLDSHPFDKICDVSCCNDLKKYLRISWSLSCVKKQLVVLHASGAKSLILQCEYYQTSKIKGLTNQAEHFRSNI